MTRLFGGFAPVAEAETVIALCAHIHKIILVDPCEHKQQPETYNLPLPSLVAILIYDELIAARPLTEQLALHICGACEALAVPRDVALKIDEERFYLNINPRELLGRVATRPDQIYVIAWPQWPNSAYSSRTLDAGTKAASCACFS